MEQIGFKNFRRFRNLPAKPLGPITLLVGGNNSGKSTLTKGALLIYNFLKIKVSEYRMRTPEFSFDVMEPFDAHISTVGRAKTVSAPVDEGMEFTLTLNGISYQVLTRGGLEDSQRTSAPLSRVLVDDNVNGLHFSFDFEGGVMSAKFPARENAFSLNERKAFILGRLGELDREFQELKDAEKKDLSALASINGTINNLKKELEVCNAQIDTGIEDFVSLPLSVYLDNTSEYYVPYLIKGFLSYLNITQNLDKRTTEYKEDESRKRVISGYSNEIKDTVNRVHVGIDQAYIEYVAAHTASQNQFYNSKDKNDYIASTIHEFAKSRINPGDKYHDFIVEWMGKERFEIGSAFEVISHGSEAYELMITSFAGDPLPMADKGMGSIQLMLLLMRLAIISKKYDGYVVSPVVLIEEPEQNLHPKLQSRLADLWAQVSSVFNLRFIIETHSEYMIRKTQSLVNKLKCKDETQLRELNPFIVYYFREEGEPYDMGYRTDGKFKEDFDKGFYDVSTELLLDIL